MFLCLSYVDHLTSLQLACPSCSRSGLLAHHDLIAHSSAPLHLPSPACQALACALQAAAVLSCGTLPPHALPRHDTPDRVWSKNAAEVFPSFIISSRI